MLNLRLLVCTVFMVASFCLDVNAQIIKGRVLRAGSDTAVANAVVYYGGSMVGTIADDQGHFELQAKAQQIPITISCVGYFSATVNYEPGKLLVVYLKPKPEELKTVTIKAGRVQGSKRGQYELLFKQEFLGVSEFSKSCTIVNLNEVNLMMDEKTVTLTATCSKPIIIQNKKLGYTITCYLDNFTRTLTSTNYTGHFIFKEDSTIKAADRAQVALDRETAYGGSEMQFVRALWHNTIDKVGFVIKDAKRNPVVTSKIVRADSAGQKYLNLENGLSISSNNNGFTYQNTLAATKKYVFIDKDGFFAHGLQWSGRMSDNRVGDMLPFEYRSKNDPLESAMNTIATPPLAGCKTCKNNKGSYSRHDQTNRHHRFCIF